MSCMKPMLSCSIFIGIVIIIIVIIVVIVIVVVIINRHHHCHVQVASSEIRVTNLFPVWINRLPWPPFKPSSIAFLQILVGKWCFVENLKTADRHTVSIIHHGKCKKECKRFGHNGSSEPLRLKARGVIGGHKRSLLSNIDTKQVIRGRRYEVPDQWK